MKKMISNITQFVVLLIVLAGCGTMLLLGDENNGVSRETAFSQSNRIETVSPVKENVMPTERRLRGRRSLSI
ncbi:MAG: hypothetical protein HQK91_11655 [Nitrospirae bacterium]|nr:hypothetical protein [Nitrospirota bacterium]